MYICYTAYTLVIQCTLEIQCTGVIQCALILQYTLVAIPNCTPLLHKIMLIVKTSGDCIQSNFPLSRTNLVLIVGEVIGRIGVEHMGWVGVVVKKG